MDHELYEDGNGYECRRCGVSLEELDERESNGETVPCK